MKTLLYISLFLAIQVTAYEQNVASQFRTGGMDKVSWALKTYTYNSEYLEVYVDARGIGTASILRSISFIVDCRSAAGLHVKYDTISFTQQPLTEIPGGKVYLRYFRHGCPRNYYFKPVKLEYRVWGIGVNYYDLPPNAAASMMDTFLPDTLGAVVTCGPVPPMSHPIYDGVYRLYIDNVEQQAALVIKNDSIFYWVDTYPSGGYQHSFVQQPISFSIDSTHFTVDLLDGCLLNGLACHLDGYLSDAGGAHISGLAWKGEIGKNTVAFYALKMDVND